MSLMPFSSRSLPRSSGVADSGGDKRSARKYTFSLSFSAMVTTGIVLIIAIGWIFAFGVIVGRGYNPEKKLPELASLLPPPQGEATAESKEPQKILKPEDLTFMTDLKQPKAAVPVKDAAQPAVSRPGTTQAPTTPPAKTPETPETQRYDFVFQAAAYKGREPAQRLQTRLESEGVRSRITVENDGKGRPKWFRVQVLLRGTDANAAETKQILNKVGLTDATQLSKKPVNRSR